MASFSLTFLGTGNAWSKPPVNFNTNVLVQGNDAAWLIDCGLLCPLALKSAGVPVSTIDGVFITHLHGDHVFGIEELLYYSFFAQHRKLRLFLPDAFLNPHNPRHEHFWDNFLCASMGGCGISLDGACRNLSLNDYADVVPLVPAFGYDFFGIPARIFPVDHVPDKSTFGICLDNRVYFTSDTTFSRQKIESFLNDGAQIIFHDVYFMPPYLGSVHASFDELCSLPRDIAEKIVLMHYDDHATEEQKQFASSLGFRVARLGQSFHF